MDKFNPDEFKKELSRLMDGGKSTNKTFSKKVIDALAVEYAEEQSNCYSSNLDGYVAGFEKAVESINGKIIE